MSGSATCAPTSGPSAISTASAPASPRCRRRSVVGREAVVVGSGAAGSVVAYELARRGWEVTVLERGRHMRSGLGRATDGDLGTRYGSDEIKSARHFGFPDPLLEPYTQRTREDAAAGRARTAVGAFGQLGAAVGGTTLHYNAKFPRFWKQDFSTLSDLGPQPGAQVADWPITYADLEPHYDAVERRVGVSGSRAAMPARTREQAPRRSEFAMAPLPISHTGQLLRTAARLSGYEAYPQPAAVNSAPFRGRPACTSCGLCSGFGCPIDARGDAITAWLNPAVRAGRVRVLARAFVHRVDTTRDGRRVTGVRYVDARGRRRRIAADTVVLAGSPINTARLLLMSASGAHERGLGNGSDQVGRNMMFHAFTLAAALYPDDLHPLRGQSNPLQMDDLMGPFTGPEVRALGVPWIKGGLAQVGSGVPAFAEAKLLAPILGFGTAHRQAMRAGLLHQRVAGSQLVGEDLPLADNRIDLDPDVRDHHGFPAARITYSAHPHEKVAAVLLGARLERMHLAAPGSLGAAVIPFPLVQSGPYATAHLAGTARMGTDPRTSVCDPSGRLHEVDGVWVADASTFPTFPGFNPTNTIMSNARRVAFAIAGATTAKAS
ncbi:hypothetical protein C7Y72_03530 [Paraconexibacter algicola]|uniref:GMC family oxidoreductase n=1 Tax=Paraconexibacter algicola TaxID=2133960 RepID=A0A2T4UHR2_9ACTN|nr:hypothetical protein C7Y72_03530 [Paraconexibacter algicola]